MKRHLLPTLSIAFAFVSLAVSAPAESAASRSPASHIYMTGKNVRGLQWMLGGHRPSAYKIRAWRHPVNGVYDKRLVNAVHNMKWRLGYPNSATGGKVAGPVFIAYLKGKPRPFQWKLRAGARVVELQKRQHELRHPSVSTKVKLLLGDAEYLIAHRDLVRYSQVRRMDIVRQHIHFNPPALRQYIFEDCSSSITGLYWLAGLPDPNGLGYNGYGYTGTQSAHGWVVWHLGQPLSLLRPGDLVFYGGGWPHHHVAMYLGNGRVFSHGTDTGPFNLPVLYRSDAVGAHRYVRP